MFKSFSRLVEEGHIYSRHIDLKVDEYRNRMELPTGTLKRFVQAFQQYSKVTWRVLRLTYYDNDVRITDDMLAFKNEYLENSGRYVKFFICNSRDTYDKVCTAVANNSEFSSLYEIRPTDTDAREYLWVGGTKLSMYILPKSDKELIVRSYAAELEQFLDSFKFKLSTELEEKYPKPESFVATCMDAWEKELAGEPANVPALLMLLYNIQEEIPDILNFKIIDTASHFEHMDKGQSLEATLAQLRQMYNNKVQELIAEQRRAYRNWRDNVASAATAYATKDDSGKFLEVLKMYIDQGIVKGIDEKYIYFLCPVTDYDLDDLKSCNSYNDNLDDVLAQFKTMEAQGKHLMMLTQIRYYRNPEHADYSYDCDATTGSNMQKYTEGRNCIWNPHVNEFHCYGTFKSFLNDAACRCDWTNWFAYASQVAHQLNFSDDTVFGRLCDNQLAAVLDNNNWK